MVEEPKHETDSGTPEPKKGNRNGSKKSENKGTDRRGGQAIDGLRVIVQNSGMWKPKMTVSRDNAWGPTLSCSTIYCTLTPPADPTTRLDGYSSNLINLHDKLLSLGGRLRNYTSADLYRYNHNYRVAAALLTEATRDLKVLDLENREYAMPIFAYSATAGIHNPSLTLENRSKLNEDLANAISRLEKLCIAPIDMMDIDKSWLQFVFHDAPGERANLFAAALWSVVYFEVGATTSTRISMTPGTSTERVNQLISAADTIIDVLYQVGSVNRQINADYERAYGAAAIRRGLSDLVSQSPDSFRGYSASHLLGWANMKPAWINRNSAETQIDEANLTVTTKIGSGAVLDSLPSTAANDSIFGLFPAENMGVATHLMQCIQRDGLLEGSGYTLLASSGMVPLDVYHINSYNRTSISAWNLYVALENAQDGTASYLRRIVNVFDNYTYHPMVYLEKNKATDYWHHDAEAQAVSWANVQTMISDIVSEETRSGFGHPEIFKVVR